MAPTTVLQTPLSPAELSYLRDSLSQTPPIRPDGRAPTEFRPLIAEADILPSTNGSARVCFADGTEAIVGIKAEVERSRVRLRDGDQGLTFEGEGQDGDDDGDELRGSARLAAGQGENSWVEMSIDVPGYRDDDNLAVFLASLLTEALVANGTLKDRLWINRRYHWKLYLDVLLLSPPLSYPLPLLSVTTHLALLSTRLPKLKSERDEDPLFDDDWEVSDYLYPFDAKGHRIDRPPITLLAAAVASNFVYDPSKEELSAADAVVALSVGSVRSHADAPSSLRLLSMRTIDAPARFTSAGVPNSVNTATGATAPSSDEEAFVIREMSVDRKDVWTPPRGGIKRILLTRIIKTTIESGGVTDEILDALEAVQS